MTVADASPGGSHAGIARAGDSAAAEPAVRGWEAALEIAFVALGGATILLRNGQRGPLAVQRPSCPVKTTGRSRKTSTMHPGSLQTVWRLPGALTTRVPSPYTPRSSACSPLMT